MTSLAAWAAPSVVRVPIAEIRPTQMAAGLAAAREMEAKVVDAARARAVPLGQAIQEELGKKPLPAIQAPDGRFYIADGHHRALAAEAIVLQGLLNESEAWLPLEILEDDSSLAWPAFVERLRSKGIGYFPAEIRERIASGDLSPEAAYRDLLPQRLQDIQDDPLRSAVGTLFYQDGIQGSAFVNYIEFLVGERIRGKLRIEPGQELAPELIERLRSMVWGDPAMVNFLKEHPHDDGTRKRAEAMVDAAVARFRGAHVHVEPTEPAQAEQPAAAGRR